MSSLYTTKQAAEREAGLNAIIYGLYKLEPAEIAMIEADKR